MNVINEQSPNIQAFFAALDESLERIRVALLNRTPHLNGEKFLTGQEVCQMLNISARTLQEWRNSGVLPYIGIRGKILFRESDVRKTLEKHSRM